MQVNNSQPQDQHNSNNLQQQKQSNGNKIEGQQQISAIEQVQTGYNFEKVANIVGSNVASSFNNIIKDIQLIKEDDQKEQQNEKQDIQHVNQVNNISKDQQQNKQSDNVQQKQIIQPQSMRIQQQKDQNNQNQGQQQDYVKIEKLQKIKQIRHKQQQLLAQLQRLKQQQKQLLSYQNSKNNSNSPIIRYQNDYAAINNQEQSSPKPNKQILSPLKNKKAYSKPKPVMPNPVVPTMSRQQFQIKVKQIANNIRLKAHKNSPSMNQSKEKPKNKSQTKQRKIRSNFSYQSDIIELPSISTKTKTSKLGRTDKLINTFIDNQQAAPQAETIFEESIKNQSKVYQAMNSLVQGIIKQAIQKISYKQKYAIKLDPVHHRYPMTVFRKKIIEEKNEKNKQKYNIESLRQSLLNQRKQIYDKSREKIK